MSAAAFRPPAVSAVRVGGFLGARADAVCARTVRILYDRCVAAGLFDQIDPDRPNPGDVFPRNPLHPACTPQMFWDSDWGKVIEAAAYCLARAPDAELEAMIDRVVDAYVRLQADDGYLSSWYLRIEPGKRWTNLRDCHELYCAGHLIEGAVAYYQATGKRALLDAVCRFADHIAARFGTGEGQVPGYDGHEEIELALVRLSRVTGERRYLDLARYFIDQRGQSPKFFDGEARMRGEDPVSFHFHDGEYNQSHEPVRDQRRVVGHAVRAMYLYSAMADIAAEYGDDTLLPALEALWEELVDKRMYVTGGIGPSAENEGFTGPYDLPNPTAYAETCASVGLVFWASRMLGIAPDARYGDVMERALYNNALAGLSLDGARFTYDNPLATDGTKHRWEWHECPCCPPNIARLATSIGSYMVAEADGVIAVHLYGESRAELALATVTQTTDYPWAGQVRISVEPIAAGTRFSLLLRLPGWSKTPVLSLNGVSLSPTVVRGYAVIEREWQPGDIVTLDFCMEPRRVYADPRVDGNIGRVALAHGPLVFCAEAVDNDAPLDRMIVGDGTLTVLPADDLPSGAVKLVVAGTSIAEDGGGLYRDEPPTQTPTTITAVPYCLWDNRAGGDMALWLRT